MEFSTVCNETQFSAIGDSKAFISEEEDKKNENSISRHVTEGNSCHCAFYCNSSF